MFRLVPLGLAFVAVSSCAMMVSHEKAVDSLRNSCICCESIAQFEYDQLPESGDISFKLDESSDAFSFQTGKSYFKALRLPEKELPYRIIIRSFALGEHISKAHIFYPHIALLDDRFSIIRQSTPGDFLLSKAGVNEAAAETWGLPIKLEGSVLVDSLSTKYILVFTTQELMSSVSPYEARRVVPVIVPGLVTAIPGGKETMSIRHSPFGLLHMEIARADAMLCQQGSEADIEPKSAIKARFVDRDALLFIGALQPAVDEALFDTVVILRGPDVWGGTVAIVLKDGCLVGRKFLAGLEYIHATQMVTLFRTHPALQHSDRLEMATLQAMAKAGDSAAQFHMGLAYAWGRGVSADRTTSIEWLKLAAQSGYSPAMLALGMALSGPSALSDEAEKVGQPPRADEFTDLVAAYFWLTAAIRSNQHDVQDEASYRLRELDRRMSPEELQRAKELVRALKEVAR